MASPTAASSMHLKVGGQGMFHFMSFSAPFVIGPENPKLYWFDPDNMKPLAQQPGPPAALKKLIEVAKFGPEAMMGWILPEGWDLFPGRPGGDDLYLGRPRRSGAGDPRAGSQSTVKGKTGAGPMPGTNGYFNISTNAMVETDEPNMVGNTTGGSWAGVISKFSKAPEATYFLLALMATKPKSVVYGYRGWDGVDPGPHLPLPAAERRQ